MRKNTRQQRHTQPTLWSALDQMSKDALIKIRGTAKTVPVSTTSASSMDTQAEQAMVSYSGLGVNSFRIPRGFTIGVLPNWIWFSGHMESVLTKSPRVKYSFVANSRIIQLPILFVQRFVLDRLNGRSGQRRLRIMLLPSGESSSHTMADNVYKTTEFKSHSFLNAASVGPVLPSDMLSSFADGDLIPASLSFQSFGNDPQTQRPEDTLATPLLPREWWQRDTMFINRWGVLDPDKIEILEYNEIGTHGNNGHGKTEGLVGKDFYPSCSDSTV